MTVRYRHHGFALVRSTTEPGDLALPHDLNLDDPEAIHSEGRVWLASAWSRSEVREAVSAASPILAARIAQLLASPELAGTRDLAASDRLARCVPAALAAARNAVRLVRGGARRHRRPWNCQHRHSALGSRPSRLGVDRQPHAPDHPEPGAAWTVHRDSQCPGCGP